jgi:hypothetical protein
VAAPAFAQAAADARASDGSSLELIEVTIRVTCRAPRQVRVCKQEITGAFVAGDLAPN